MCSVSGVTATQEPWRSAQERQLVGTCDLLTVSAAGKDGLKSKADMCFWAPKMQLFPEMAGALS